MHGPELIPSAGTPLELLQSLPEQQPWCRANSGVRVIKCYFLQAGPTLLSMTPDTPWYHCWPCKHPQSKSSTAAAASGTQPPPADLTLPQLTTFTKFICTHKGESRPTCLTKRHLSRHASVFLDSFLLSCTPPSNPAAITSSCCSPAGRGKADSVCEVSCRERSQVLRRESIQTQFSAPPFTADMVEY